MANRSTEIGSKQHRSLGPLTFCAPLHSRSCSSCGQHHWSERTGITALLGAIALQSVCGSSGERRFRAGHGRHHTLLLGLLHQSDGNNAKQQALYRTERSAADAFLADGYNDFHRPRPHPPTTKASFSGKRLSGGWCSRQRALTATARLLDCRRGWCWTARGVGWSRSWPRSVASRVRSRQFGEA
jgi:hypothetical protein